MTMPLEFRNPELLLLAIPAFWAYWRWGRARGATGVLRVAIILALLLAIAAPRINIGGRGLDLFVIVDRSRSMRQDDLAQIRELVGTLEENRGPGDRVGIITFGAQAKIERPLSETETLGEFAININPHGSNVRQAIERALALARPRRPTRLLVFSDGQATGPDPRNAARAAGNRGIPIDVRAFLHPPVNDAAVDRIELPDAVAPNQPFPFYVEVSTDYRVATTLVVSRDGQTIESREVALEPGRTRFRFLDQVPAPAFASYSARLLAEDSRPRNNRAAAALRVTAGPRILLLNDSGRPDHLSRVLSAADLPVDVVAADKHPLTQDALDPYNTVILENVPASDFRRVKLEQLAQFVTDLGGGLMMTGGRDSFGSGGYLNSPLEPILPLSMELENDRKDQLAMVIVLDHSGSMAMPAGEGLLKMDLASRGAIEAIRLLSPQDRVAVLAVDTAAQVIVPLQYADDHENIVGKVRRIRSAEGGIYIEAALRAAADQLDRVDRHLTRHIILFSDAADSERPGDYRELLPQLHARGITVSVIGLGTPADPDAALLREIAALGHGNIVFTNDARELPRLFTQEAMSVVKDTFFIAPDHETIPGRLVDSARLMGDLRQAPLPDVRGYNLTQLKSEASLAAVALGEHAAPWSAFWYHGLGRVVAITFEADGQFTGPLARWPGYDDFFLAHLRWLRQDNGPAGVFIDIVRRGRTAVVTIELDPERNGLAIRPTLRVIPPGRGQTAAFSPTLTWIGPHSLQGRFRLRQDGTYRTLVRWSQHDPTQSRPPEAANMVRGPTVTLPYSPEFASRFGRPTGQELLLEIARLSGGHVQTNVVRALENPPPSRGSRPLLPYLMIAAVALLVIEIAGRRLALWSAIAAIMPSRKRARQEAQDLDESPPLVGKPSRYRGQARQQTAPTAGSRARADNAESRLKDIYARAKNRVRR